MQQAVYETSSLTWQWWQKQACSRHAELEQGGGGGGAAKVAEAARQARATRQAGAALVLPGVADLEALGPEESIKSLT